METGVNLDITFWTYEFYLDIKRFNSFLERITSNSPVEKATFNIYNLSSLCTFGCRVYVQPHGNIKYKLKTNVFKIIFLVYDPHTIRNML